MSLMVYIFRVILTVPLSIAIFAIIKNRGISSDGLETMMITYLTYFALPVLVCVVAIFLPVEIALRKRNLGVLVNVSPGLGAACAAIMFWMTPDRPTAADALLGVIIFGACCGVIWASTSFLNGPQSSPANSCGSQTN